MKLICDKCGEEIESGIANVLKHQFEDCKAHYIETIKDENGNDTGFKCKVMPYINPTSKTLTQD